MFDRKPRTGEVVGPTPNKPGFFTVAERTGPHSTTETEVDARKMEVIAVKAHLAAEQVDEVPEPHWEDEADTNVVDLTAPLPSPEEVSQQAINRGQPAEGNSPADIATRQASFEAEIDRQLAEQGTPEEISARAIARGLPIEGNSPEDIRRRREAEKQELLRRGPSAAESQFGVTAAFNPTQPRDKNGRWVEMGSLVKFRGAMGGPEKAGEVVGTDPIRRSLFLVQDKEGTTYSVPGNRLEIINEQARLEVDEKTKPSTLAPPAPPVPSYGRLARESSQRPTRSD